jgi:TolA-binding protein
MKRALLVIMALAGTAGAQVTRTVSAGSIMTPTGPGTVADSAIDQLERIIQRYPDSPLRAGALFELGELLVRRADERFAVSQRGDSTSSGGGLSHPDYSEAIARYQELITKYPNFDQIDGAAYTLGTLYSFDQRYAEAVPMFELVGAKEKSPLRAEALFRLGDAEFELASGEKGDARLALFAKAATAYERAVAVAPPDGDVYFLSLYKLGWAYYNTATSQHPEGYSKAVEVFGQLVDAYDKLTPERQQRLALRGEAMDYMAVSFTQVGGAPAANRFFGARGDSTSLKIPVLRRVAARLRDQGAFPKAVDAYQELLIEAPDDSSALSDSREIIDIYQNRTIEPEKAQQARLALVQKFGPGSSWVAANPTLGQQAATAREQVLREAAQYELAKAQAGRVPTTVAKGGGVGGRRPAPGKRAPGDTAASVGATGGAVGTVTAAQREHYVESARLYGLYLGDYGQSDSARAVDVHYADALYGAGDYRRAGTEYTRAAYGFPKDSADPAIRQSSQLAAQNAIVAWDSVETANKADKLVQDSLFAAVDRYAARYPQSEIAKRALVEKGKRAAEAQRWDVEASTFRTYAAMYPNDAYTPTAQKQVGDALYKQGSYADAQAQWDTAYTSASRSGRKGLADSVKLLQQGAASAYADSLVKHGQYGQAATEVYVAFADKNPSSSKAPDALRNAIETYLLADSVARVKGGGDSSESKANKAKAAELSNRLVTQYPTYQYRLQYQVLYADLLWQLGLGDQSIAATRSVIAQNPAWKGRADAEIKIAVRLDSLSRAKEAAAQYEQFASDFPKDPRAADALYNAAVTYVQGQDSLSGAKVYGEFATRFPADKRAAQARVLRVTLLKAAGDSTGAGVELARLCGGPNAPAELKGDCAKRAGRAAFATGVAQFMKYRAMRLVIPSVASLTAAGVKRLSKPKLDALALVTRDFTQAIESGDPDYIAAGSYYIGLAQWEYGNFLKNVVLPRSLSDADRQAASAGAAQQGQAYYLQAQKTWQALLDKATRDNIKNKWIDLAGDGVQGKVPDTPPTASAGGEVPYAG